MRTNTTLRALRILLVSGVLLFLGRPCLLGQSGTPPTVTIKGQQGDNKEGTPENPFNGSGIHLFLIVEATAPINYSFGSWEVAPAGSFCPGRFQFFGTENIDPSLKHPRVANGVASLKISAFVEAPPFAPIKASTTFFVEKHPEGCGGAPEPDESPEDLLLVSKPPGAKFNETIRLEASAKSPPDSSLVFLFYVSSTNSPSTKGILIESKTATGCFNGCEATANYKVADHPTVHYFLFEAKGSKGTSQSEKIAVQVSAQGSGGGGGGGEPPPAKEESPVSCNACGSTIDAGPKRQTVVGGRTLELSASAKGPTSGEVSWRIVDDAGLGSKLKFLNQAALKASLQTPEVSQDTVIRIEFQAVFNGCPCADSMEVVILSEAPPEADLLVEQTAPAQVQIDQDVTFEIQVQNNGPSKANNVEVIDVLPDGMTFRSATTTRGSCVNDAPVVNCKLGSLGSNSGATVKIVGHPARDGTFVNNVSVKSDEIDPKTSNNSAQAVVAVDSPSVNLRLSKTVDRSKVIRGEKLHFEIEISNDGGRDATKAKLTDSLPSGLEYVSSSTSQGSCSFLKSVSRLICELGTLGKGKGATVEVVTKTVGQGSITNTASVSAEEQEGEASDNEDSATATVEPGTADLELTFLSKALNSAANQVIEFTARVVNHGPQEVDGVLLEGDLPEGFKSPSASTSQGSCQITELELKCTLGKLPVDQEVEVKVSGLASKVGENVLKGTIVGSLEDPLLGNNEDQAETMVEVLDFLMIPHSLGMLQTFVSMAVVNLADGPNTIDFQAVDRQGEETASLRVDSPLSFQQNAFLTRDLVDEADTIVARGTEGPIRSFFMMGSDTVDRLDGIGGLMPDSKSLYFNLIRRRGNEDTILFLFNSSPQDDTLIDLELYSAEGVLLQTAELGLAPMGSFRARLGELFGDVELATGYVRATSTEADIRGFELLTDGDNFSALTGRPAIQTRKLYVPHFVGLPGISTILSILNTATQAARGRVGLRADDALLITEFSIEIPAGRLATIDLHEMVDFEALGSQGQIGYLELSLEGGTAGIFSTAAQVVPTVAYEHSNFSAALPMLQEGYRQTLFLHVAQDISLGLSHGLAILNTGKEAATGRVQVFDSTGSQTGEVAFVLKGGERIVDLLNGPKLLDDPHFSQIQGHIRVVSDRALIAFSLFTGEQFLAAIEGQELEEQ